MSSIQKSMPIVPSNMVLRPAEKRRRSSWDLAMESLTSRDRSSLGDLEKIEALIQLKVDVEKQREICKARRWKIGRVVLRDVLGKILIWVEKLIKIGDMVVQYDPGHAALPWACMRLILQIAVNEHQTLASVAEGLEYISNLLGRCALIEYTYLDSRLPLYEELVGHVADLYGRVLRYLATAMWYYNSGFTGRVSTDSDEFQSRMKDIVKKDTEIDRFAQIVIVQNQQANHREILETLREPINQVNETFHLLKDHLRDKERFKIMNWVSAVPFKEHHENIRQDRLPRSGEWLFEKRVFRNWREDSSCSILWLHGIPGSGKSKLASLVIDNLSNGGKGRFEPLAFFYCARNTSESARGDGYEILRCLLKQLLCLDPSLPVLESVRTTYKDLEKSGLRKLRFDETKERIIDLTKIYPSITIVVDALEECDPKTRWILLGALEDIIASSANLVKIFISSRSHDNIASKLRSWPQLPIGEQDNAKDIESFIDDQVEQAVRLKRILQGNIPKDLRNHMVMALTRGARGMFQWVSLQLQSLCNIVVEDDIKHELQQLHEELKDVYFKIYQQISALPSPSRSIAERVLSWLLCSQRNLTVEEFLSAVSLDSKGTFTEVTAQQVLDMCCNFVVLDKTLNVFRFAHHSVREYLESESRPEYTTAALHALAAERCLFSFLAPINQRASKAPSTNSNDVFKGYATLYWAVHCQRSGESRQIGALGMLFQRFVIEDIGANLAFKRWSESAFTHMESISRVDPFKTRFESMLSRPASPFFAACIWGFEEVIRHYETSGQGYVQSLNIRGYSGLHLASQYGQQEIVLLLLQGGAAINAVSRYGSTALHLAAENGNVEVVKILLEKGASIQARDTKQQTALHYACQGGNIDVSQLLLLKEEVDVKAVDKSGRTALHQAAENGSEPVVELLLQNGADIEAMDKEGRSPLYEAAEKGHENVVATLLDYGADPDAKERGGWMALGRAVVKGYESVVRLLLSKGANIKGRVGDWTALHWAVGRGKEGFVRLLIEYGADVAVRDGWGKTPLHRVAGTGHESVALQLLIQGADIEAIDNRGCTALGCAAEEGDITIVQAILGYGANAAVKNHDGKSPLHQAAARGHERVVEILLNNGADIKEKDSDEKLALHLAAVGGHGAVVRLLLEKGAEDVVDDSGKLALHLAAEKGKGNVIKHLLESKMCLERGYLDSQDHFYGMTACHWAAKEGHLEVVKLLLDKGANADILDYEKMTVWEWMEGDPRELSPLLEAMN